MPLNVVFLLFKTSFALPVLLHLSNIVYVIASNSDDLPDVFAAKSPQTSDNLSKFKILLSPYENMFSNSNDIGCHVVCRIDSTAGNFELMVRLICRTVSSSCAVACGKFISI